MRFEKAWPELRPKRRLQDKPIISEKMAMSGKIRMDRQWSEVANRLQIGGSSVFCWTKARRQLLLPMLSKCPQSSFSGTHSIVFAPFEQKQPLLLGLFFLQRVKDAFSQQRKACPTISLSFDQFQFRHVSLNHAVIDPPGETSSYGVFVFLHSLSKRLQFGKVATFHLLKPGIKMLSCARAQHLCKLLNQVIGPLDFWVDLTELAKLLLLLDTQFFRAPKKQKGSLS
jgi:hypothetical protein